MVERFTRTGAPMTGISISLALRLPLTGCPRGGRQLRNTSGFNIAHADWLFSDGMKKSDDNEASTLIQTPESKIVVSDRGSRREDVSYSTLT
jgi:hypothetical protein